MIEKLTNLFKGLLGKQQELMAAAEEMKDLSVVVRDLEMLVIEVQRIALAIAPAVADLKSNNMLSKPNVKLVKDAAVAMTATAEWGDSALREVREAYEAILVLIPPQYR